MALSIDSDTNVAQQKVKNIAIVNSTLTAISRSVFTMDTNDTSDHYEQPLQFVRNMTTKHNFKSPYLETVLGDLTRQLHSSLKLFDLKRALNPAKCWLKTER